MSFPQKIHVIQYYYIYEYIRYIFVFARTYIYIYIMYIYRYFAERSLCDYSLESMNPTRTSVVCRACWRLPVHSIVTNGIRPKGGSGKLKNDGESGCLEYDHLTVEYMYVGVSKIKEGPKIFLALTHFCTTLLGGHFRRHWRMSVS